MSAFNLERRKPTSKLIEKKHDGQSSVPLKAEVNQALVHLHVSPSPSFFLFRMLPSMVTFPLTPPQSKPLPAPRMNTVNLLGPMFCPARHHSFQEPRELSSTHSS